MCIKAFYLHNKVDLSQGASVLISRKRLVENIDLYFLRANQTIKILKTQRNAENGYEYCVVNEALFEM